VLHRPSIQERHDILNSRARSFLRETRNHTVNREKSMHTTKLMLMTAILLGAAPLSGVHAQSTATTVQKEADVAWAKFKGAWTQTKGEAKEQWGKLTDDDLKEVDGRREVLVGKLQTRYAISHEEAERQVGTFEKRPR
jgi:uncharacterized protein YjbJ (UPF0337 family)